MVLAGVAHLCRPTRKKVHVALHSAAGLCTLLALVAAFKSHSLKRPIPIPDLYSPHSWLGLATVALAAGQFGVGTWVYLWPGAQPPIR